MSKIDNILSYSNFEAIRSKIAYILADELSNQKTLNETALAEELAKPSPDPLLVAFYELNIASIPGKVFEERFFRPQIEEIPLINVVLLNVPLNEGTSHTYQIGENKYQIEIYQNAKSKETEDGDVLATRKLHRLLAMVRSILMDRNYVDLEMPGIVTRRQTQDIVIGIPKGGADDSMSSIFGKIDLLVKVSEEVSDLEGIPYAGSSTTVKLNKTEKGLYWEIEAA